MHDLEPWWGWRDEYVAELDKKSPFYGREYDEFMFTRKIYNYFIHPQWDSFGSETLYGKLLYVNYGQQFAIIQLIGEWNDCIENDIMYLKRTLIDPLICNGIFKFVILCDYVLNYHGDDDSYYEEWYDDIKEDDGWICLVNTYDHVSSELKKFRLHYYMNFGMIYNDYSWRKNKPNFIIEAIENTIKGQSKKLN